MERVLEEAKLAVLQLPSEIAMAMVAGQFVGRRGSDLVRFFQLPLVDLGGQGFQFFAHSSHRQIAHAAFVPLPFFAMHDQHAHPGFFPRNLHHPRLRHHRLFPRRDSPRTQLPVAARLCLLDIVESVLAIAALQSQQVPCCLSRSCFTVPIVIMPRSPTNTTRSNWNRWFRSCTTSWTVV